MTAELSLKEQVRRFYDAVGWREIGDGLYQNARYEDLRPVSREYLRRCHLRVGRHLPAAGKYLLDAGSGPIQYPEYLAYSEGFRYRVCLDISRVALIEARARIADRGLYVVGDVAHLPFKSEVFEGLISLHTVHHLPAGEHELAFRDFYRSLGPGGRSVVVYSWGDRSALMRAFEPLRWLARSLLAAYRRLRQKPPRQSGNLEPPEVAWLLQQPGTYTFKHGYGWVLATLSDLPEFEIRVWRSVSTAFLRAFIHRQALGELWLRMIFGLEERFPHLLGRHGQYPMILFTKPANSGRLT